MSHYIVSDVLLDVKHFLNQAFAVHQVKVNLMLREGRSDFGLLIRSVASDWLEHVVFDLDSHEDFESSLEDFF